MDRDRVEGAAKNLKGKVKEAAGKVTGDAKLKSEGKADQVAGKVQNAVRRRQGRHSRRRRGNSAMQSDDAQAPARSRRSPAPLAAMRALVSAKRPRAGSGEQVRNARTANRRVSAPFPRRRDRCPAFACRRPRFGGAAEFSAGGYTFSDELGGFRLLSATGSGTAGRSGGDRRRDLRGRAGHAGDPQPEFGWRRLRIGARPAHHRQARHQPLETRLGGVRDGAAGGA